VEANDGEYTYLKIFAGVTMLAGALLIAVLRFYVHHLAAKAKSALVEPAMEETGKQ
jgi:hypothetical protein